VEYWQRSLTNPDMEEMEVKKSGCEEECGGGAVCVARIPWGGGGGGGGAGGGAGPAGGGGAAGGQRGAHARTHARTRRLTCPILTNGNDIVPCVPHVASRQWLLARRIVCCLGVDFAPGRGGNPPPCTRIFSRSSCTRMEIIMTHASRCSESPT
jgi:hypothetical protein